MAKNTNIYGGFAVNKYISDMWDKGVVWDMETIPGGLCDTYILYHDNGVIEVFEEKYLNEWSSGYIRHIYRKGLPKRFRAALEELELEEVARAAYYESLQNGTLDILGECI